MNAIFILLYGLLFMSGVFMLPAWLRVTLQAYKTGDKDYMLLSAALTANSFGTILVFGPRLVYGFRTGSWVSVDHWTAGLLAGGIAFLGLSKIMLMMVRRNHGERKAFMVFAILSALWALFAVGFSL